MLFWSCNYLLDFSYSPHLNLPYFLVINRLILILTRNKVKQKNWNLKLLKKKSVGFSLPSFFCSIKVARGSVVVSCGDCGCDLSVVRGAFVVGRGSVRLRWCKSRCLTVRHGCGRGFVSSNRYVEYGCSIGWNSVFDHEPRCFCLWEHASRVSSYNLVLFSLFVFVSSMLLPSFSSIKYT